MNLVSKWDKKYLLLMVAILCIALYFFGSSPHLPDPKFLRPLGYLCLGLSGMLQLMTN